MNSTKRFLLMVALIVVALVVVACETEPGAPVIDPTLDFTEPDLTDPNLGAGVDGELSGQIVATDGTVVLPDDATVIVQLVEVSDTNATAQVLAESTIQDVDSFPVDFTLNYDPTLIDANAVIAVQAVVTDSTDSLIYANMNQYRVLTAGNPVDDVELFLEPMQSQ